MDLFETQAQVNDLRPLAEKLRPQNFEQFISHLKGNPGFENILAQLKSGQVFSLILWGPPGSGKTSFANVISKSLNTFFVQEHAVDLSTSKIKALCEDSKRRMLYDSKKTILFIDEIHRLNKSQQDIFLPFLEQGYVYILGATTENPSYELNKALMSRCRLLVFEPHNEKNLMSIFLKALNFEKIKRKDFLSDDAIEALILNSSGDARMLLNAVEELIRAYQLKTLEFPLDQKALDKSLSQAGIAYDKSSEEHYNVISAFIKSIRGSDADAGVYYLARMLKGGESPVFIARRLVVLASEDIGNADPTALNLAISTLQAVELIGLPEARINLAQCVCYLACAPKSNASYKAINKAMEEVELTGALPVPKSLRSAKTALMKEQSYGKGYKYSHDYSKHWVDQEFFPEKMKNKKFYEPTEIGFEKRINEYLKWLKS